MKAAPPEDYEFAEPEPAALIESLRAFGYSLPAAVADLVDNSISAGAQHVWIHFEWRGHASFVALTDNGSGMTEPELVSAMRPGCKSPLEQRPSDDLGRFGLGLKTASFSQCRRLSVRSQTISGSPVSRCWDIDYVNSTREWRLLKHINEALLSSIPVHLSGSGTTVIWENLDRIVGGCSEDDNKAYNRFLKAIEDVRTHLSMVFHRFLEGRQAVKMSINGVEIEGWDPFVISADATQELPAERLTYQGHHLVVTPFVLPHSSKISTELHRRSAGPNGWNAQQGFYVYRNRRLLVPGSWLSLGFQKEEHYKLARLRIDLPNSMDSDWQIDVKKSKAIPPGELRDDLRRIARLTREKAAQIYRHRGKLAARRSGRNINFVWEQRNRHGKVFFSINRSHPLIELALRTHGKELLEPSYKLIEETLPSATIKVLASDEANPLSTAYEGATFDSMKPTIHLLYRSMLAAGYDRDQALDELRHLEPFNMKPEILQAFSEEGEI